MFNSLLTEFVSDNFKTSATSFSVPVVALSKTFATSLNLSILVLQLILQGSVAALKSKNTFLFTVSYEISQVASFKLLSLFIVFVANVPANVPPPDPSTIVNCVSE